MTGRAQAAARSPIAGLALLAAVFVATRLALVWRFPPHTDESLFAWWTLQGYEDAARRFEPLTQGQNPMQEWLGMALVSLGAEPLTALRLLSLAAGLVSLAAVWWLARDLAGEHAALAAGAVWVLLPFTLVYGAVGVADPIVAALAMVALVLARELARRPRVDLALALGIVLGIGALTKLTMLSAVWLVPLGALLVDWRSPGLAGRVARWLGAILLAGAVAWLLYQVLRLSPLWPRLDAIREERLARHGLGEFLDRPGYWIERNWTQFRLAFRGYLTVPGIVAAAVGLGVTLRRTPREGLYLLGWIVLPVAAVTALAGEPFLRWLLIAVPPIAVCAGIGVVELVRLAIGLVSGRGVLATRAVGVVVVAAFALPALAWGARTLADPAGRPYPSRDDVDLVQAYSAGGPWFEVVDELERVPGPVTVATIGNGLEYLFLALRREPVRWVPADALRPDALIALQNTTDPLPPGPTPLAWRTTRIWERPRDGLPVTLSQRGVVVGSRFASTPAELRAALGGGRGAVERLAAREPAVRAWLRAWRAAYPAG